jgi:peptidyl-tRNA hydrolase
VVKKPASDTAWLVEMIRRSTEMRATCRVQARPELKRAYSFVRDLEMFEAAMDALMRRDIEPGNGYVPEAVPGFAALLVRVVEQTAAEFGVKAAALALRWIADEMESEG